MALPTSEQIKERVLEGFDRDHYDGLYAQQSYAFGEKWSAGPSYIATRFPRNDIPIYPDVTVRKLEIGQSRRILNAAHASLSRFLSRPPLPKFPQVDEPTDEVRRQFWLANANGNRGVPTKWLKQMQYAFVDGDTLGVGCVVHGLRKHPTSGLKLVDMKHVPALQVIWDPFQRDPRNSKWVCVIHYVPAEEAKARWGEAKVKKHVKKWTTTSDGKGTEFVRVFQYFDAGYAGKDPAEAVFVGELEKGKVEANGLGFIPVSFAVNFVAPGMRRPIGRVSMQMSTQEMINELERYMRDTIRRGPPVDVYDPGAFDAESLARLKKGSADGFLEIEQSQVDDIAKIFKRFPGREIPQTVLALFGIQEKQYDTDSNQSDARRGQVAGGRTTAAEIATVRQDVTVNSALTGQMATEFLQDAVHDSMGTALAGDLHRVALDIFGNNIEFNVTDDPNSRIGNFLEEESKVVIDLDAATAQDDAIKQDAAVARLQVLVPFVGRGIKGQKFLEKLLEASGVRDPENWIMQPEEVAQALQAEEDVQPSKAGGSTK